MIALICFVLASLTLAEWLCRTVDRINPARVLGPRYCFERGTSTPDSKIIRRLLQLRQNASVFAQGCADFSSDSGPEAFVHTRSLVDFITITSESRFSVHTGRA